MAAAALPPPPAPVVVVRDLAHLRAVVTGEEYRRSRLKVHTENWTGWQCSYFLFDCGPAGRACDSQFFISFSISLGV